MNQSTAVRCAQVPIMGQDIADGKRAVVAFPQRGGECWKTGNSSHYGSYRRSDRVSFPPCRSLPPLLASSKHWRKLHAGRGARCKKTSTLEPYWMPFTANRQFKSSPRIMVSTKDMHYTDDRGRRILDASAGMWCVNAGHGREKIIEAIRAQAGEMDYAPAFQCGHPGAFDLSSRLTKLFPGDLDYVFYANSGSEAVDTALKMALAYHQLRGDARRTRLIGRERGYHGVGIGGTSVGGISNNRKYFGNLLAGIDHLPHTHNLAEMAFSQGQPDWGVHLADDLEQIVALHDASTIAAVIIEPVAGSTGVLVPPKGYLEKFGRYAMPTVSC